MVRQTFTKTGNKRTFNFFKHFCPDKEFRFNAIQVNINEQLDRHRHTHQNNKSIILLMGDFTGGALCVEKDGKVIKHEEKYSPIEFDGNDYHWVEPFIGTRISFVFYTAYSWYVSKKKWTQNISKGRI